jgi:exosortase D (VPLPA-CTERM-specific)
VASAPVIAVLINSFRIAIIAVLVDSFGSQMAEGFLHQFEGWVVFLVGAVMLGFGILALEKFQFANINIDSIFDRSSTQGLADKSTSLSRGGAVALISVCGIALAVVNSITTAQERAPKPLRQTFENLPHQINGWSGRDVQLEPAILDVLKATDSYEGNFSEPGNKAPVNLFVAYYDSLSKGAAIHSPRVCLPGSGWEFASFEERDFSELGPGSGGTFNRVIIQKGEQKILMYYWFHQRERRTAGEFKMKYYLLLDSFRIGRKDGALVRLYTPLVGSNRSSELEAERRLAAFAEGALPLMNGYLPR